MKRHFSAARAASCRSPTTTNCSTSTGICAGSLPASCAPASQHFKVLLIFRHSLCRSAELFVKHAQASMSYGHWVLDGSCLAVGLFSFLLMQFPILLPC